MVYSVIYMFVKIRVEGTDKVIKARYEGQNFEEVRMLISVKLELRQSFEVRYADDDGDQILINDENDWEVSSTIGLGISVSELLLREIR